MKYIEAQIKITVIWKNEENRGRLFFNKDDLLEMVDLRGLKGSIFFFCVPPPEILLDFFSEEGHCQKMIIWKWLNR
jgi:hypothetical protein